MNNWKTKLKHLIKNRARRRSQKGIGALEVAISAGLMIIVVAIAVDVTILNYAFSVNDAACRDAARAAAACSYANPAAAPSGQANALTAAQTACRMHATDGWLITQPALKSTASPDFVYDDSAGFSPPPPTTAYVTVTTFVNVRLPIPLFFMGNNASGFLSSNGGKISFVRRYTFPIVRQNYTG